MSHLTCSIGRKHDQPSGQLCILKESRNQMMTQRLTEGRLVVHEEGKPRKEEPSYPGSDARSEAGSFQSLKSRKTRKRRKTSNSRWAYTGSENASKKAGGDVKRKDKLEPSYAYWPLDRKMMSCRPAHGAAARKGMARVVKLTKKLEGKSACFYCAEAHQI